MWWPGGVLEGEAEVGRSRMMGRRRVRAGRLVGGLRVVRVVPATRRGVPSYGDDKSSEPLCSGCASSPGDLSPSSSHPPASEALRWWAVREKAS